MNGKNVFVSSTCYDLIDVRAEVEGQLRSLGFVPVLSDSSTSGFQVDPTRDSIETCLVNVRACDVFVMILSSRYGPSLRSAGYDDISATHMEYRVARTADKPVLVYARDRLIADYDQWRAQGRPASFSSRWIAEKDTKLLALVDEHTRLVAGGAANWIQPFRSSVDLKEVLARDLRANRPDVILERLLESGRVPDIRIACTGSAADGHGRCEYDLLLSNLGDVHAHVVCLIVSSERGELTRCAAADAIKANERHHVRLAMQQAGEDPLLAQLRYVTPTGMELEDDFHCVVAKGVLTFVHVGKRALGRRQVVLGAPCYPWTTQTPSHSG